jgi:flagella basal body P-ring formation protein FlgA
MTKYAMTKLLVLAGLVSSSAFCACIPIVGDRIYGSDLAAASPAFASLRPDLTIAYAPTPGAQRIFAVAELVRIARANRIEISEPGPAEVCFEIPMRPMNAEETLESMRRALPPEAELSVVELPKTNIPVGKLDFPLSGLEPNARGGRVWRGSVRYGDTLRMPIWARVTVQRKYVAVVAAKDLPLNEPIDPSSLRMQPVTVPIDSDRLALRIEDVLGRVPRKAVRAGETIPIAILNLPPTVHRGDAVRVEVRSGSARLVFDAVAQGPACEGDMVELRNPTNGKTFRARLEDSGRAVIVVPSRQSL